MSDIKGGIDNYSMLSRLQTMSMEEKIFTVTITVHNRNKAYSEVSEILHNYASRIKLRIGYPFEKDDVAIIFLIIRLTNDELGAFTGKLGQLELVNVKATAVKMN